MKLINIFKRKEEIYDDSSDCFLAMQYALEQYKKEEEWLSLHRKVLEENNIISEEQHKENKEKNSIRYSLEYMYKKK